MMDQECSLEELHRTKLYKYLVELESPYAERITTFVQVLAPILATTQNYFPLYTRHDSHHGYCVVRRIEQVIDAKCLQVGGDISLRPVEVFLLIAAAYAHDLGMTVFPGEEEELRSQLKLDNEGWQNDERLLNYLRKEHSKRGGKYILENAKTLAVPDNLIRQLDLLMCSHNMPLSLLEQQLGGWYAADEHTIDLRQLAVLLCVGDLIEFSDKRVNDGVIELARSANSQAGKVSYEENRKHECIGGSFAIDNIGQVIVAGTFTEPEVLACAHRTLDEMEDWIQGYCDIDRNSVVPRLRIRPEPFKRRLDIPGARFERLGVRMNKKSIIDLIASNAVWKNNEGIAVRELVQNAVEACRYREYHSSRADNFTPEVRVEFDRLSHTIIVSDNGCGMSERTVLNNFLTVGSSRSKEPSYASDSYEPIARFGIGFWSVFTVAEWANIETFSFESCKEGAQGFTFDVALDELKDYTIFESKEVPVGTSVKIKLKPEIILDDVYESTKRNLLTAEVNLIMILDGEETIIPHSIPDITEVELFGNRQRALTENGIKVFQWSGTQEGTDLSLALAYKVDKGKPTFRVNQHESVLSYLPSFRTVKNAVCGFITSSARPETCFALTRVGSAHANHRSPKGFEFSLDRNSLVENEAQREFVKSVNELIHSGYREFLKSNNAYYPEAIFHLNEESELAGGNVYDTYTGSELSNFSVKDADLLCFKLIPVDAIRALHEIQPIYVDYHELKLLSGKCWVVQTPLTKKNQVGSYFYVNPEDKFITNVVYRLVQKRLNIDANNCQNYVLIPNRRASMLFDADSQSTAHQESLNVDKVGEAIITLQCINLDNVNVDPQSHDVLAQVKGKWSGAIYLRDFQRIDSKPYMFLGRQRVLVQRGTKLSAHLEKLKSDGRLVKIVDLVSDLQEDDQGYKPESLIGLI